MVEYSRMAGPGKAYRLAGYARGRRPDSGRITKLVLRLRCITHARLQNHTESVQPLALHSWNAWPMEWCRTESTVYRRIYPHRLHGKHDPQKRTRVQQPLRYHGD